jgi:hypothetical protein
VKHHNRFGCRFVTDRAASASTGEGSCWVHVLFECSDSLWIRVSVK